MTYTKVLLSGSTQGKQIKVTGTNIAGADTIHTAVAGVASLDEIWLYAYNHNTTAILLTILWGGTGDPDNKIAVSVPAQSGRILVCDGMLLQNSLVVKAYAGSANLVMIDGFVNRIA